MKPAILLCALVALPTGTRLSTDYAAPRTLRIEAENELEMETTRMSIERDGEVLGGDFGRQVLRESTRTLVHDTHLSTEDGLPTKVRRRIETAAGVIEAEFGERTLERERESPFEGVVLVLEREEDGDVRAVVVEGTEPDDPALLRGHRLELGLDALLPEEEVEVGARWELESEDIRRALGIGLDRRLFPAPTIQEAEGAGGRRRRGGGGGDMGGSRFLESVEWEGTAKLVSLSEDVKGERCARIELEFRARGELPESEFGGGGGGRAFGLASPALENSYEIDLEGELVFALESRCPLEARFEGRVRLTRRSERERDGSRMVMESEREGTWRRTVSITPEAREGDE